MMIPNLRLRLKTCFQRRLAGRSSGAIRREAVVAIRDLVATKPTVAALPLALSEEVQYVARRR